MTVLNKHGATGSDCPGKDDVPSMTLRDCPLGEPVLIDAIDLDERHRFRLREIGLAPGTSLKVTQHGIFGGRVVARNSERIALDGGTARSIRVRATRSRTARPTEVGTPSDPASATNQKADER